MQIKQVFLENVIPALGGLVAVVMCATPLKEVFVARREKSIGDINPLPFPVLMANSVGWVIYSFVVTDAYIYVPNQIGFLLSSIYTFTCYGLVDQRSKDLQLGITLFFALIISIVGVVGAMANLSHHSLRLMWGFTANAILLCYYSSPLTTMYTVIRMRDSSSLYLPLSLTTLLNGALWTAYGLAITDYFVWVPNAIGAVLAVVTVVLELVFPKKAHKAPAGRGIMLPSRNVAPSSPATKSLSEGICTTATGSSASLASDAGDAKLGTPQHSELHHRAMPTPEVAAGHSEGGQAQV